MASDSQAGENTEAKRKELANRVQGLALCGEAEYPLPPRWGPRCPQHSVGASTLVSATQLGPQPASAVSSQSETQHRRPPPQFSPAKWPWPAKTYCHSPIRNPASIGLGPTRAFLSNSPVQFSLLLQWPEPFNSQAPPSQSSATPKEPGPGQA